MRWAEIKTTRTPVISSACLPTLDPFTECLGFARAPDSGLRIVAYCFETFSHRLSARQLFTIVLATTVLVTTAFLAGSVSAGQLEDQIKSKTEQSEATDEVLGRTEGDGYNILAVPVPIIDPTLGNGLALAGLLTFPAADANEDAPRSTLGIAAARTDTDSWMVGAGFKLYLAGDRYRAGLIAGYGNLNLQYYGVRSGSPFFDHPVGFLVRGTLLDASVQARVASHLYAGLKGRYINPVATLDQPIDLLPGLRAEFELAALGVTVEYDTRDNVWYPVSGRRGEIELLRYASQLGSDETFLTLDASYSGYWGLSERLVLGGSVRALHAGDDTPFFMLPFVSIRGFPAGQYMNQSVVQGQTELRWKFRNDFGAVVFAGAGIAAPGFTDLGDGSNAYGFGGGLRYRISDVDKLNIGLDVAYGSSDDVTVYFRIGEAF